MAVARRLVMRDYPVDVEVFSPPHFDRIQLLLRLGIAIVLGWIGITAGWLVCLLFATLPLIAATAVTTISSDGYHRDFAPRLWRVLSWMLQLSAYMVLLVDRFPTGSEGDVRTNIRFTGRPTPGSAMLRLITSIPSGVALCVLWFFSGLLWLVAFIIVLLGGPMPQSILAYQRGVLRWQARLVAYHASLVDEYPPFSFDTGYGHTPPMHAIAP